MGFVYLVSTHIPVHAYIRRSSVVLSSTFFILRYICRQSAVYWQTHFGHVGNKRGLFILFFILANHSFIHFIRFMTMQVEFPPTFEEQVMDEQWTWDQNPINLTCIATGIPNATITWWYRDREIDREIIDRNYQIYGRGPRSDLIVTPLSLEYYGRYTCKAENPHGDSLHEIELIEAREPSYVQQAITDKVTATTIQFRFVAPTDTGGLPIDSYAVQYKEAMQEWNDAYRRLWPASDNGVYVLENLQPRTTYDFRFAAKNLVGFSEWGSSQQFTMPQRGPPEAPRINAEGYEVYNDVVNISSPTTYELAWFLPEDNGEPIDFFEISFYPVRLENRATGEVASLDSLDDDAAMSSWKRVGSVFRTEVPHPGNVRYIIRDLYTDAYHMVEIRAHNNKGYSPVSSIVVKTAKGGLFLTSRVHKK